jgi:energy-coupling factor transporter ATP-binding protein EcfA2
MPDERYKLSGREHENVFKQLLKEMLETTEPQECPSIVILGGQPGSGKSKLTEIARGVFFDDKPVAVINGDDYRQNHPQARKIYDMHDKRYAEMTDPDVRKWTPRLLEAAIEGRRDIIFEATMRNREPLMTTIKHLKEEGYKVGVFVLAANEHASRIGIVSRYENQKFSGKIARWTPTETHDEAYKNMPATVEAIELESPIDHISVYGRGGRELYKNEASGDVLRRPLPGEGARRAIRNEHLRPLSASEKSNLRDSIEEIRPKMSQRGAEEEFGQLQGIFSRNMEAEIYRDAVLSVREKTGNPDVKPPKYNKEYGPGKMAIDGELALLTLDDSTIIAYRSRDALIANPALREGEVYPTSRKTPSFKARI